MRDACCVTKVRASLRRLLRHALDDARTAHAAADAHGHEAVALLAAAKLVEDGYGQLRARATERMAERDGAAVDVDPLARQRAFAHDGERLTSEGFVEFDQVEVFELEAGLLEGFRNRGDRADAHDPRWHAAHRVSDEAGERLQSELVQFFPGHHHDGCSAVAAL